MCGTKNIDYYQKTFDRYDGVIRTKQLDAEHIFHVVRQQLIADGHIEKVRHGYYQWVDHEDFSEVDTVMRFFPDAILFMVTALRYNTHSETLK